MHRHRSTFPLPCLVLALALAACNPSPTDDDSAPPEPSVPAAAVAAPMPAPAAEAPVVASETAMAQAGVQPPDAGFDARAFAGPFAGTLPCADCPGIDERLVLSADGSFTLTDTYRERPGSEQALSGHWSLEADGQRIRLDPGSKTAQDRLFAIEDGNTLVPLGADGQDTGGPGDPRLRRSR